jgi:hypothetical protein
MPQLFDHYVSPSRRRVRSAVRRRDRASVEPVISRKSVEPGTRLYYEHRLAMHRGPAGIPAERECALHRWTCHLYSCRDIRALEVAMHDSAVMGMGQCVRDLRAVAASLFPSRGPSPRLNR